MASRALFVLLLCVTLACLHPVPANSAFGARSLPCVSDDVADTEGDPGDGVLDPAADASPAVEISPYFDVGTAANGGSRRTGWLLVPVPAPPGSPWPLSFHLVPWHGKSPAWSVWQPPSGTIAGEGRWHDAP